LLGWEHLSSASLVLIKNRFFDLARGATLFKNDQLICTLFPEELPRCSIFFTRPTSGRDLPRPDHPHTKCVEFSLRVNRAGERSRINSTEMHLVLFAQGMVLVHKAL